MTARTSVAMPDIAGGTSAVEAWARPEVNGGHVYQTMPPLSRDDADALERSIRTHGVQVPIIVDEAGNIIDGHHRREIAERCGLALPVEVRADLDDAQKVALSISLNVDRRQLTREQKRLVIAASIKAAPEATDREHARRTGSSPTTVAAVRDDLEESGEVSKLDTRRDPRGYDQPASKPPVLLSTKRKSSIEETETIAADAETGEILDHPVAVALENVAAAMESAEYHKNAWKHLLKARDLTRLDPERFADMADEHMIRSLDEIAASVARFHDAVHKARPTGLRVIEGGKK